MSDFLVEVTPGREVVYRTPLALRAAMRSGEITSESRIYHRAGSRWIPITEHPEYRKFLAERRPVDWLEPIPFQQAPQPEPAPVEASDSPIEVVKGALQRAAAGFRAWLAKVTAPPELPPKRSAALPEPEPERPRTPKSVRAAPPAPPPPPPQTTDSPEQPPAGPERRRWTFYP